MQAFARDQETSTNQPGIDEENQDDQELSKQRHPFWNHTRSARTAAHRNFNEVHALDDAADGAATAEGAQQQQQPPGYAQQQQPTARQTDLMVLSAFFGVF